MAAPSEIEKLERRYAENPDGRFFAPLADAYRKAGSLDRALELVRAGLAKHPDYLSAHIVLGRCLLDKGDDVEAERTFRAVLDLDAENIIALKSLAEITERTGRTTEARKWLQQLLAVDSMNTEAEADLQRLGGVIAEQPTQPIEAVAAAESARISFADIAPEVEPASILEAPLPAPAAAAVMEAPPPPAVVPVPPAAVVPAPPAEVPPPVVEQVTPVVEHVTPVVEHVAPVAVPAPPAAAEAPPAIEPVTPALEPVTAEVEHVTPESEPAPIQAAAAPAAPETALPETDAETGPAAREAAPAVAPLAELPGASFELLEPAPPVQAGPPGGPPPAMEEAAAPPAEPVPDRHPLPQELQVTDAGLDLMPFDDSLAWGTGERSSRAISADDIATIEHNDALVTPAAEFLAGLPGAGTPPAEATPAPAEAEAAPAGGGGRAEAGEFTIEHDEDLQVFDSVPAPAEAPLHVELPADLSGSYSIIDVPEPSPPSAAPRPSAGLPLIMPEDVTPAEELKRPSSKLVQMVSPALPPEPTEEKGAVAEQAMLSETLGDLYLRQGFKGEAADVYRRLLSQRPGDEGLQAKLRALEAPPNLSADSEGAESVGTWLRRVATARLRSPSAPAPEPSPGPTPLDAAFAAPVPDTTGEPAHPAQEAFSLEQIFGTGEAPGSAPPEPAPAAAPPPATGTSFDEFFGAPQDKGTVRPATETPEEKAASGEEDLSAFNAWLQGLKR